MVWIFKASLLEHCVFYPTDAPAEGSAPVGEKEKEKDSTTEPATTEDKKAGGDGEEANADGEEQAKDDGETPDGEKTEEAAAEQGKSKKKKVKDVVAKM